MDKVPIYLSCWHVLKAWHLHGIKKIKDVDVRGGIFQDLHDVTYMSINHGKKTFKILNLDNILV
jgi:dTDP-4-dehydrorhamnose 3,5-epimerase-like enzyme